MPTRPLEGKRIVIARSKERSGDSVRLAKALGADAVSIPLIAIEPPEDPGPFVRGVEEIEKYSLVIFTSQMAVDLFAREAKKSGIQPDQIKSKIAAIGEKTAAAARKMGFRVDCVPLKTGASEELIGVLMEQGPLKGVGVFFPRAQEGREVLIDELKKQGARLDAVACYRTVPEEKSRADVIRMIRENRTDWILLTSGSQAKALVALGGEERVGKWLKKGRVKAAAIGKVTAEAMKEAGMVPSVVSSKPTIEALLDSVGSFVASG